MDDLAVQCVAPVKSGMMVGLGTGRAAARGVHALAAKVKAEKLDITCVSTSKATEALGASLGLKIVDFARVERVDFLFDGADELDPQLNMLKGGGAAMTRERIVAAAAVRRVNILDESKLVAHLGQNMPLPVEVIPMGLASVNARLRAMGLVGVVRQRKDGPGDLVTDNGNLIIDCALLPSANLAQLAREMDTTAGIVDHGLFLAETQEVLIEGKSGVIRKSR
ncbi:MAG: ribose-5-phosphate isomerase RpiA [Phycisphaerales bacterium]